MNALGRPAVVCLLLLAPAARAQFVETTADPASVRLRGPTAVYTLLIHGRTADGRLVDRTRDAHFRSLDPKVAAVSAAGVVRAAGDGRTTVVAEIDGKSLNVAVSAEDATAPRRFNFENDVEPLLSRYGCNSAGCHGKAEGQNGFKLSVFGFDPAADYAALVKEARGRRIFPASPGLQPCPPQNIRTDRPRRRRPHPGRLRRLRDAARLDRGRRPASACRPTPRPTAVRVEPRERVLAPGGKQQLRVIATYSDGREADVTALAKFQSNNDGLASVQPTAW